MSGKTFKLWVVLIIAVIVLWAVVGTIGVVKVEGNEAVVRQNIFKGVVPDVWLSGTHFYLGWIWDVYKYDIGTQKITFDDKNRNKDAEYDRVNVNVGENGGQSAWISLSVNYRIGFDSTEAGKDGEGNSVYSPKFSPAKLVALHKDGLQNTYESVILKRTIIEVINKVARPQQALVIYSGAGYNQFVEDVKEQLENHPVFRQRGIFIENVVVYNVELNPKYEAEIEAKQLAMQTKLRKMEETKAAEEEAKRVFAASQAEVEARTQKAEAQKIERIKAAEAEKAEQVLMAEGKRDSDLAKAAGVIALGEAEAQVAALKRDAMYAGESGKRRAEVKLLQRKQKSTKECLKELLY